MLRVRGQAHPGTLWGEPQPLTWTSWNLPRESFQRIPAHLILVTYALTLGEPGTLSQWLSPQKMTAICLYPYLLMW